MLPLLAVGAGLAIAGAAGKFISGIKQKKEAKAINPIWQQYQQNPFAKQQLSLAQQGYNDPSMGTRGQLQRNLFSSQGNTMDAINKNATDSSQALALQMASQGQTNESLSNENMNFMNNKAAMLQNLNQAYGVNINEGNKEYESLLQKYGMDTQRKDALNSAGATNKFNAVSDLASMSFSLAGAKSFGGGGGGGKVKAAGLGSMDRMYNPNLNLQQGASPAMKFGTIPYRPMIK